MKTGFWHGLSIRMGRALPPIARLHDHRNALVEDLAARDLELDRLRERCQSLGCRTLALEQQQTTLHSELGRFREHADYVARLRGQGRLVEFDYPYRPKVRNWDDLPEGNVCRRLIASGTDRYREQLLAMIACKDALTLIPAAEPADERQPFWANGWFPVLDAICLTGMLVRLNPRRYVEVGSGNSTKFASWAIAHHGLRTEITSIDPHPRAVVDDLCQRLIRTALEDCDLQVFTDLGRDDLVFIDNSHRSFQNSDVTVFFTEILPVLKSGCYYGIHDIFLPYDYPESWYERYYNEQYLLLTYLIGGATGDEIVLPVHFIQCTAELVTILDPIVQHPALAGTPPLGGAFWMMKA